MKSALRGPTVVVCLFVVVWVCGSARAWDWPGEPGEEIQMSVVASAPAHCLEFGPNRSTWVTCVGSTIDFVLFADDYDFVYPSGGYDDLSFSNWRGDPPYKMLDEYQQWTGMYCGEWTNTFSSIGRYVYNPTACDAGNIYTDGSKQYELIVIVVNLTLDSPEDDMRFIVGMNECDIAVIATVDGYYPADASYDVRWWVTPEGGGSNEKGSMTSAGEGRYTAVWNTDYTERGNWEVKTVLYVNGNAMCSAQTADIFCAKPTWPMCSGGTNGLIVQWLHGDSSWLGVDVDISGTGCSGTTPLLASEDGSASPHQFTPSQDPCNTTYCYANLVSYNTFNVRLVNTTNPTYDSRSLQTDHWHMMNAGRTSGTVDYHQSLGNGGYSGNVQGSHDHFITKVNGSCVSPDRTGATGNGSNTS